MTFKTYRVGKNIPLLIFRCPRQSALSFCRFQEHYESSNARFRERPFTFREFKRWYINEAGSFSYPDDWGGFNVPSKIIERFERGLFNPLFRREEKILEALASFQKPYYVIGTYSTGNKELGLFLRHELSHALFFTSRAYRKNALAIIESLIPPKTLERFKERLAFGYGENTLLDEIHAYLATKDYHFFDGLKIPARASRELEENLERFLALKKISIDGLLEEISKDAGAPPAMAHRPKK